MYVRVKRKKTTVFLEVAPQYTLAEVKAALEQLLQEDAGSMRLYKGDALLSSEAKTLADLGIQDDDELGLVLKSSDGDWESLDVVGFDAAEAAATE